MTEPRITVMLEKLGLLRRWEAFELGGSMPKSARQESNRAHGSLERALARPRGNDEHPICHRTTEISSSRTAFPPTDGWGGGRRAERIRIAERTRGVRRTVVFGISARGCPARRHQPER